jgi:hypothetical protein
MGADFGKTRCLHLQIRNVIWRRVQVAYLLIMQFPHFFCYLFCRGSGYRQLTRCVIGDLRTRKTGLTQKF